MSLPRRRTGTAIRSDILIGAVASVVVLALAALVPGKVGELLAVLAVGGLAAALALASPLVALILVVLASFFRLAQKEIISNEALTPTFCVLVVALALATTRHAKRPPRLGVVEWLMAAYLAWNITSWLLPHQYAAIDPETGGGPIDIYRWILTGTVLPFAMYIISKSVLDDERSVRVLLWTTVGMCAYSSWVSILQFHGPQSLVWPRYIVDAPNWAGRANGVFNQPVVNGIILDIGFVVCFFLASRPGTRRIVQVLLYFLAAAAAYSVYLTHTRAALLAMVVLLGIGMLFASGWRRAFVLTSLLGLAAVAASASTIFSSDRAAGGVGSSSEVYDRLNIIATGLQALSEHPFIGIGIARFANYNTSRHLAWSQHVPWGAGYGIVSHENEVGIAAELGLPGVALYIAIVVAVLWSLWRAMRELPRDEFLGRPLAVVGAIALVIMVVNGTTVDLRILDFAMILPFVYAGMVVGQLERHRAKQALLRWGVPGGNVLPGEPTREGQDARQAERGGTSTERPLQSVR